MRSTILVSREDMLTQQDILEAWRQGKSERQFYRLTAEVERAFEYRGPQFGHPSNYASIRIHAAPSSTLRLDSVASYPPSVTAVYAGRLLAAIGRAAVDELLSTEWYPHRGCSLTVREVGWDEIMSSEVAIYLAARGALADIRRSGAWEINT
jgi:hypothetical protein